MVAGFRRPRGRCRVAEWVEVRFEQRPHVDRVGPPGPVEVRVQPVEGDLGTAGFDPHPSGGDPIPVELGDHVAALHLRHPLDGLDMLRVKDGRSITPSRSGVPATEKVTIRPRPDWWLMPRRCGS